jgi:hypothetical protein
MVLEKVTADKWIMVRSYMAVSSAYVPMRVFSEEGMSAVNRMYKTINKYKNTIIIK